jgi:inorganic pyrophosphatase
MNFKINNRKPDFFPKAKGIPRGSMELRTPRQYNRNQPKVEVVIEIPRGSFVKRGWSESVDFISPVPCPFNYGAIPDYIGGEGDLLDAVVLGPRLPRGTRVRVIAQGAVGLTDRGIYDDKLICSNKPLRGWQRHLVLIFFHIYGLSKRLLNFYRGRSGPTYCNGWQNVASAIARARPRSDEDWKGPAVPF